MKDPEWERSNFRLLGVPGHLYKETAKQLLSWFAKVLRRKTDAAFANECRVRFFRGFFRERRRQGRATD
jgi:hypothetical protein